MIYCLNCKSKVHGRSDKRFCSLVCKNNYNYLQRSKTKSEVQYIDQILHRNHIILSTLMGDLTKVQLERLILVRAKFNFQYFTSIYKNKENKIYYLVYNFAWMEFSDQHVLIVKRDRSR
ncbi:MAG: hypothetical protein IT267_08400 [Saprospiraceae bacterium]|nr:hypothetical protein [Saprospiraceae bacterium]